MIGAIQPIHRIKPKITCWRHDMESLSASLDSLNGRCLSQRPSDAQLRRFLWNHPEQIVENQVIWDVLTLIRWEFSDFFSYSVLLITDNLNIWTYKKLLPNPNFSQFTQNSGLRIFFHVGCISAGIMDVSCWCRSLRAWSNKAWWRTYASINCVIDCSSDVNLNR